MARKCPDPQLGTGSLAELTVCGATASTPPATQSLLRAADDAVLAALFAGYVGCGHMVDGNIAGKTQIQVGVCLPPGVRYARAHVTRCGDIDSAQTPQTDTTVGGTTAGLPATIAVHSPRFGTEKYLGTAGAAYSSSAIVTTGSAQIASPDPSRAIALIEQKASQVAMVEVNRAAGFCIEVIARTVNLETL